MKDINKLKGGIFGMLVGDALGVPYEFHEPEYSEEFEFRLRPDEDGIWVGNGGGYVIDSLRSTVMLLRKSASYEEVVKGAIALGHDTDTTACIAGGLAGIIYGYEGIPQRWLNGLREKKKVDSLLDAGLAE